MKSSAIRILAQPLTNSYVISLFTLRYVTLWLVAVAVSPR